MMEGLKMNININKEIFNSKELQASTIIGFIIGISLIYITDFVSAIQNIEGFFIVTLTIILINATLSLLSFTYVLSLKSTPIEHIIINNLGKNEGIRIIWSSAEETRSTIINYLNIAEKRHINVSEKVLGKLDILKQKLEKIQQKNEDVNFDKANLDTEIFKHSFRISELERTSDLMYAESYERILLLQALVQLYRTKLAQKGGELFFLSTIISIIPFFLLGLYLLIIHASGVSMFLDSVYKIPNYILFIIVLGLVFYAILLFIRGIINITKVFRNIKMFE